MPNQPSRTLGIDLAAQPKDTAACLIEWGRGKPRVVSLSELIGSESPLDDETLIQLIESDWVGRVGIDAPFGWPLEFIDAIAAWRDHRWPVPLGDPGGEQAALVLRETDREVIRATVRPLEANGPARRAKHPLRVSADRIAVAAMRCVRLLHAIAERSGQGVDRAGGGRLVEVYPDAALREWGLWPDEWDRPRQLSCKGKEHEGRRKCLMDNLIGGGCGWLEDDWQVIDSCIKSDDELDALLSALVARAVERGLSQPITDQGRAQLEGWIHLPMPGSLGQLAE